MIYYQESGKMLCRYDLREKDLKTYTVISLLDSATTTEGQGDKVTQLYVPAENSDLVMIGFECGQVQIRDTLTLKEILFIVRRPDREHIYSLE